MSTTTKTKSVLYDQLAKVPWDWHFLVHQVNWLNTTKLVVVHALFVYGNYYVLDKSAKLATILLTMFLGTTSALALSLGCHRHWSHRSFKATWPLKVFLLLGNVGAMNVSALCFARDHRLHHKYPETPADPNDANRGLFYSHCGSYLIRKHPMVLERGRKHDFGDLYADKLLVFEHEHYHLLSLTFGVIVPWSVPVYLWNESVWIAFYYCVVFKVVLVLQPFYLINSISHAFGERSFDKHLGPTDNRLVNYVTFGEGCHSFHHRFPSHYRSSPYRSYESFQPASLILELLGVLGLASDFKETNREVIDKTMAKYGDQEHLALLRRHRRSPLGSRLARALPDYFFGLMVGSWFFLMHALYKYLMDMPICVF